MYNIDTNGNLMEYHQLENTPHRSEEDAPDDDPIGRWSCSVDKRDTAEEHFNFVEVHKSYGWLCQLPDANKLCVIRVSTWTSWEGIRLGDCVMLNKAQVAELRDRLNTMLEQM